MPTPEGLLPRAAALNILDSVLRKGRTLDQAAGPHKLPPQDMALSLAICGEVLRRLPDIDDLIDSATRQRLPDDSKARMVLRLALAQKLALNVPDHALVATALPLVDGGPRRLVHGVLGTLLRRGVEPTDAPRLPDAVEYRWQQAWGEEMVLAARRAIANRPPLDLSFSKEMEFEGQSLAPKHRRLQSTEITGITGFAEGQWWVQDLAASLPARLIPYDAHTVVDACAAPGGKTMQLAAAGLEVIALDRSESRLARLSANLIRTHLTARLVTAEVLDWSPPDPVDAVLLDAPCSSTGTFRRHPEVLYRASPRIITESAEQQGRMLDRAASWLKPGGSLIYAVCSLEPQEGEAQAEAFLDRHPDFVIALPTDFPVPVHERGWVRTLPGMLEAEGGLDGFFTVRLVRNPD